MQIYCIDRLENVCDNMRAIIKRLKQLKVDKKYAIKTKRWRSQHNKGSLVDEDDRPQQSADELQKYGSLEKHKSSVSQPPPLLAAAEGVAEQNTIQTVTTERPEQQSYWGEESQQLQESESPMSQLVPNGRYGQSVSAATPLSVRPKKISSPILQTNPAANQSKKEETSATETQRYASNNSHTQPSSQIETALRFDTHNIVVDSGDNMQRVTSMSNPEDTNQIKSSETIQEALSVPGQTVNDYEFDVSVITRFNREDYRKTKQCLEKLKPVIHLIKQASYATLSFGWTSAFQYSIFETEILWEIVPILMVLKKIALTPIENTSLWIVLTRRIINMKYQRGILHPEELPSSFGIIFDNPLLKKTSLSFQTSPSPMIPNIPDHTGTDAATTVMLNASSGPKSKPTSSAIKDTDGHKRHSIEAIRSMTEQHLLGSKRSGIDSQTLPPPSPCHYADSPPHSPISTRIELKKDKKAISIQSRLSQEQQQNFTGKEMHLSELQGGRQAKAGKFLHLRPEKLSMVPQPPHLKALLMQGHFEGRNGPDSGVARERVARGLIKNQPLSTQTGIWQGPIDFNQTFQDTLLMNQNQVYRTLPKLATLSDGVAIFNDSELMARKDEKKKSTLTKESKINHMRIKSRQNRNHTISNIKQQLKPYQETTENYESYFQQLPADRTTSVGPFAHQKLKQRLHARRSTLDTSLVTVQAQIQGAFPQSAKNSHQTDQDQKLIINRFVPITISSKPPAPESTANTSTKRRKSQKVRSSSRANYSTLQTHRIIPADSSQKREKAVYTSKMFKETLASMLLNKKKQATTPKGDSKRISQNNINISARKTMLKAFAQRNSSFSGGSLSVMHQQRKQKNDVQNALPISNTLRALRQGTSTIDSKQPQQIILQDKVQLGAGPHISSLQGAKDRNSSRLTQLVD